MVIVRRAAFLVSRLFVAAALAGSALAASGCAADETTNDPAEDDVTGTLPLGTFTNAAAPAHWTIQSLVLQPNHRYVVKMYPGRAFDLAQTRTTTGTYEAISGVLTLKFDSGSTFNAWTFKGSKAKGYAFVDRQSGETFTLNYTSSSTATPPVVIAGTDPGAPPAKSGDVLFTCHSQVEGGDVRVNVAMDATGRGALRVSSPVTIGLTAKDSATLAAEPGASSDWIRGEGDGAKALEKHYSFGMAKADVKTAGTGRYGSLIVSSQNYYQSQEYSYGLLCDVAFAK